jgi:hypothetical protein
MASEDDASGRRKKPHLTPVVRAIAFTKKAFCPSRKKKAWLEKATLGGADEVSDLVVYVPDMPSCPVGIWLPSWLCQKRQLLLPDRLRPAVTL